MNRMTRNLLCRANLFSMLLIALSGVFSVKAAPPWEQIEKLVAADGDAGDAFGLAVALEGNLAVIGAQGDGDNGSGSGAAYVIDVSTGQQIFKLFASDETIEDYFGTAVAISGNLAVIGAPFDDDNGNQSGSAYIFDLTTGRQLFKLIASDGKEGDEFGTTVAINGKMAVIGAPFDNGTGINFVYVFDVTTGREIMKLRPDDASQFDGFGTSVAISGNMLVIGALNGNDNGSQSGTAYVYDLTTGRELFKLLPSDGKINGYFGYCVAVSDNLALVGALGDNDNGIQSGSAYVFDVTTGEQLFKLLPSDGEALDEFGKCVAINGKLALVGERLDDDNGRDSGSVYAFDATTGLQFYKFVTTDGEEYDRFGASIAIDNNRILIGSENDSDHGFRTGSAYLFEQRTTNYLSVEPMPLFAGEIGTFSIVQSLPNEETWLLYSLRGLGRTFIPPLNITIDLNNPKVAIGPGLTDGDGNREVIHRVPIVANSMNIWFQAVQRENATNFIQTQIVH